MIKIKPITLGLPAKQANRLFVRPIINSTQDKSCSTYYEVIAEEQSTAVDGIISTTSTVLATGNIAISEEQYAGWGASNDYLDNIVLKALGLVRE